MKKIRIFFIVNFFMSISFFSCTNHSLEDLIDPIEEIDLVTYTDNVKPIIDNNCIFCHNSPPINGAPNSLLNYNQVKNSILNANLISRISAQSGEVGAMPFGGPRLPQNLIDIIVQWQTDGLLE